MGVVSEESETQIVLQVCQRTVGAEQAVALLLATEIANAAVVADGACAE